MKIINKLLLLITCVILSHHAIAKTSVWKVSKGEDYFYLGGTIHLLAKSDYPLPQAFQQAYQDADTIYFETDLAAVESNEFQQQLVSAMTFSDGQTLKSVLDSTQFQQLESFMAEREIPINNFLRFKPWGLSIMLSVMEYQRLGMVAGNGVEAHFKRLAKADNKTIKWLETPAQQLGFLSSMERLDANKLIAYTLQDMKEIPEVIKAMRLYWRSGDVKGFAAHSMYTDMQTQFPEMHDIILTNRNNEWMKQIPALINNQQVEFILVGALHLVGEENLLKQLKDKGFKIEYF